MVGLNGISLGVYFDFFFFFPTFGKELVTIIMKMIKSSHYNIVWNGNLIPNITLSRGIRQGIGGLGKESSTNELELANIQDINVSWII